MILLWGLPGDVPLIALGKAIEKLRVPYRFLNQHETLKTEVELYIGNEITGVVRSPSVEIELGNVTGVYLRPHDSRRLPSVLESETSDEAGIYAASIEDALLAWSDITPALVINRLDAMATNSSKPYQAMHIQAHNFEVPSTLITTDPNAVLEFWHSHNQIIYKSISGIRSIVSRLTDMHKERLNLVNSCPTQFQEFIDGIDYRVHVVGKSVFPCRIVSKADDYRYASRQGESVAIESCTLPIDLCERCIELTENLGLVISGIDLRRTPEGRWYCFEVNPSPGFTYYEEATGQPIADAIAKLLAATVTKMRVDII